MYIFRLARKNFGHFSHFIDFLFIVDSAIFFYCYEFPLFICPIFLTMTINCNLHSCVWRPADIIFCHSLIIHLECNTNTHTNNSLATAIKKRENRGKKFWITKNQLIWFFFLAEESIFHTIVFGFFFSLLLLLLTFFM